jgi:hypothetical protein
VLKVCKHTYGIAMLMLRPIPTCKAFPAAHAKW